MAITSQYPPPRTDGQKHIARGCCTTRWTLRLVAGMRVSDVIRNTRVDLSDDADLSYALVVSEINARRDISVTPFSILDALSEPGELMTRS